MLLDLGKVLELTLFSSLQLNEPLPVWYIQQLLCDCLVRGVFSCSEDVDLQIIVWLTVPAQQCPHWQSLLCSEGRCKNWKMFSSVTGSDTCSGCHLFNPLLMIGYIGQRQPIPEGQLCQKCSAYGLAGIQPVLPVAGCRHCVSYNTPGTLVLLAVTLWVLVSWQFFYCSDT